MTTKKTIVQTKAIIFVAKKIGTNLIAKFGKEEFTRKVNAKEAEEILAKMVNYNKRPTEAGKKTLLKLLAPIATKEKEVKETTKAKAKGIKQQIKKERKKTKGEAKSKRNILTELEELLTEDDTAIPKLQAIIDKFKKVEEAKPVVEIAPIKRGGEY